MKISRLSSLLWVVCMAFVASTCWYDTGSPAGARMSPEREKKARAERKAYYKSTEKRKASPLVRSAPSASPAPAESGAGPIPMEGVLPMEYPQPTAEETQKILDAWAKLQPAKTVAIVPFKPKGAPASKPTELTDEQKKQALYAIYAALYPEQVDIVQADQIAANAQQAVQDAGISTRQGQDLTAEDLKKISAAYSNAHPAAAGGEKEEKEVKGAEAIQPPVSAAATAAVVAAPSPITAVGESGLVDVAMQQQAQQSATEAIEEQQAKEEEQRKIEELAKKEQEKKAEQARKEREEQAKKDKAATALAATAAGGARRASGPAIVTPVAGRPSLPAATGGAPVRTATTPPLRPGQKVATLPPAKEDKAAALEALKNQAITFTNIALGSPGKYLGTVSRNKDANPEAASAMYNEDGSLAISIAKAKNAGATSEEIAKLTTGKTDYNKAVEAVEAAMAAEKKEPSETAVGSRAASPGPKLLATEEPPFTVSTSEAPQPQPRPASPKPAPAVAAAVAPAAVEAKVPEAGAGEEARVNAAIAQEKDAKAAVNIIAESKLSENKQAELMLVFFTKKGGDVTALQGTSDPSVLKDLIPELIGLSEGITAGAEAAAQAAARK